MPRSDSDLAKAHERYSRNVKANKLAVAAEILNRTADEVTAFTTAEWAILAEAAQCNPPSDETKGLTVLILRANAQARARLAGTNPFQAFRRGAAL